MSYAFVPPRRCGAARRWAVRTVAVAVVGSGCVLPVFAAPGSPSVADALEAAVARELDSARIAAPDPFAEVKSAAPRRLPATVAVELKPAGPSIRQVAEQQPKGAASADVLKELDAMYRRDGREMPSMRVQDAPYAQSAKPQRKPQPTAAPASSLRPAGMVVPPAPGAEPARLPHEMRSEPAAAPGAMTKMKGFFGSMFGREDHGMTTAANRGGRSSRSAAPSRPSGSKGLFSGFGFGRSQEASLPQQPPVPPELPRFTPPASVAAVPAAPAAVPASVVPPAPAAPPAELTPPSSDPLASARVFDDWGDERPAAPARVSIPDTFAEVRGDDGPLAMAIAEDDFRDAATKVAVSDGTPRRLDADQPATRIDRGESRVELDRKLAERSGLGGFQGFCPVALRDRRTLVDARPEFLTVYEGRTYEFSSAEAKARFEASPERYAPAQGGRDVVLAARGETEVEGNLSHAAWFKDRLYLFRTAESLKEFNAQPAKFAPGG